MKTEPKNDAAILAAEQRAEELHAARVAGIREAGGWMRQLGRGRDASFIEQYADQVEAHRRP